jgi:hypothetical protein
VNAKYGTMHKIAEGKSQPCNRIFLFREKNLGENFVARIFHSREESAQ